MPRRKTRRSKIIRKNSGTTKTWSDLVLETLDSEGGQASLDAIYSRLDGHPRAKSRRHWKAKIRQVLELHPDLFARVEKGVWGLTSLYSATAVKRFACIRRKECPKRSDTG